MKHFKKRLWLHRIWEPCDLCSIIPPPTTLLHPPPPQPGPCTSWFPLLCVTRMSAWKGDTSPAPRFGYCHLSTILLMEPPLTFPTPAPWGEFNDCFPRGHQGFPSAPGPLLAAEIPLGLKKSEGPANYQAPITWENLSSYNPTSTVLHT